MTFIGAAAVDGMANTERTPSHDVPGARVRARTRTVMIVIGAAAVDRLVDTESTAVVDRGIVSGKDFVQVGEGQVAVGSAFSGYDRGVMPCWYRAWRCDCRQFQLESCTSQFTRCLGVPHSLK